jgi:hypothetical protein
MKGRGRGDMKERREPWTNTATDGNRGVSMNMAESVGSTDRSDAA